MTGPGSAPPDLPSYRYLDFLGRGGFADVFRYEDMKLSRKVAIKVLRARDLSDRQFEQFRAEATLMARVEHLHIVPVYEVGTVPSDGRPYLSMPCYSSNLAHRARAQPMRVSNVLRIGVEIASAVQMAHSANLLHRDIKPANILVDQFDRPALTDFGIAGVIGPDSEVLGFSIAYAPPEVLLAAPGGAADVRSDVYSLAATLYTLLAGRSPFEVAGDNGSDALRSRVLDAPLPPIGRLDVQPQVEHVLRQALARDPGSRPPTALAFAQALQQVQQALELPVTALVLPVPADEGQPPLQRLPATPGDETSMPGQHGLPRHVIVQPVAPVLPQADPSSVPAPPTVKPGRDWAAEPAGETEKPTAPPAVETTPPPEEPEQGRSRRSLLVVGAVVVAAAALSAVALSTASSGEPPGPSDAELAQQEDEQEAEVEFVGTPDPPTAVSVARTAGGVMVTWEPRAPEEGDSYRVTRVDAGQEQTPYVDVTESELIVPAAAGERPCVRVAVVRDGRISPPSAPVCLLG